MLVIIDRFEGEFAVVELPNRQMINCPRALLPPGAMEGSAVRIELDQAGNRRNKKRVDRLMDDLWEKE